MITQPITIENGLVMICPTANGIWLTQSQIADLFGVFTAAVSTNIRAILKSSVLHEARVLRRTSGRNGKIVERYNLEMITALAFRLKSENAEVFRRWIVERAMTPAIVWKVSTSNNAKLN